MSSYQIPQFLDSGDKIIGDLNMRQFGYALGGGILSFLIYTLMQNTVPGIGFLGLIPASPVAALTAYLALGKFNGRDSEIYVLKYVIFASKPKKMVYARVPQVQDINTKLAGLTFEKINKRWNDEVNIGNTSKNDEFYEFGQSASSSKAVKIRNLGKTIDLSTINTMSEVYQRENEIKAKEALLKQLVENRSVLRR